MARILNAFPQSPPAWRGLYNAAIFEPDASKLLARIDAAEEVILQHTQELFQKPGDHSDEQQALDDAMYVLHALRHARRTTNDSDYEEAG
jgi:hypothetical protein